MTCHLPKNAAISKPLERIPLGRKNHRFTIEIKVSHNFLSSPSLWYATSQVKPGTLPGLPPFITLHHWLVRKFKPLIKGDRFFAAGKLCFQQFEVAENQRFQPIYELINFCPKKCEITMTTKIQIDVIKNQYSGSG